MAENIDDTPSVQAIASTSRKRQFRFAVRDDVELLRLAINLNPYNAPHGGRLQKWQAIAISLREKNIDIDFRRARDRCGLLLEKWRDGEIPRRITSGNHDDQMEKERLIEKLAALEQAPKTKDSLPEKRGHESPLSRGPPTGAHPHGLMDLHERGVLSRGGDGNNGSSAGSSGSANTGTLPSGTRSGFVLPHPQGTMSIGTSFPMAGPLSQIHRVSDPTRLPISPGASKVKLPALALTQSGSEDIRSRENQKSSMSPVSALPHSSFRVGTSHIRPSKFARTTPTEERQALEAQVPVQQDLERSAAISFTRENPTTLTTSHLDTNQRLPVDHGSDGRIGSLLNNPNTNRSGDGSSRIFQFDEAENNQPEGKGGGQASSDILHPSRKGVEEDVYAGQPHRRDQYVGKRPHSSNLGVFGGGAEPTTPSQREPQSKGVLHSHPAGSPTHPASYPMQASSRSPTERTANPNLEASGADNFQGTTRMQYGTPQKLPAFSEDIAPSSRDRASLEFRQDTPAAQAQIHNLDKPSSEKFFPDYFTLMERRLWEELELAKRRLSLEEKRFEWERERELHRFKLEKERMEMDFQERKEERQANIAKEQADNKERSELLEIIKNAQMNKGT